jgi:hypothetical protein
VRQALQEKTKIVTKKRHTCPEREGAMANEGAIGSREYVPSKE